MANHSATKKSIRQTEARTERNRQHKSRVKTYLRKADEAIASAEKDVSKDTFRKAEAVLMAAAQKGLMHKKKASRTVSRLSKRVKAL